MSGPRRRLVWRLLALVPVLASMSLPVSTPASAGTAPDPSAARRVIVVSVPGLGFDDVTPRQTPNLVRLADRGATGALSVKTIGRRTDRAGAYATLGAGARAVAPDGPSTSGRSASPDDSGSPRIVVPDLGAVVRANAGTHQGAVVGALGTSLRDRWTTAVVANHDGPDRADRLAALALAAPATGDTGTVDRGSVDPALTTVDADGRRRTDPAAVLGALDELDDTAPADRADTLVLVEIGDVSWSEDEGATPTDRRRAVTRADALLGRIAERLDDDDALLVLAPTAPAAQEQPTPFLLVAPGTEPGHATSATTRRAGSVTLPDVTATLVTLTDGDVPPAVSGTVITSERSAASGAERWSALRSEIAEQRFVDRSAGIFLVTFPIVFACWALLALLVAVLPVGRPARTAVRVLGLGVAATPVVTYLVGGLTVGSWGQPAWSALVWSLGAAGGVAAWRLGRPARAAVAIAAVVWLVLVVDVLTGGALQYGTPLGNSPTVAGRFSGLGNNAFGLLAASGLVLAVAAWCAVTRSRPGRPALAAAVAVLAVTVVVDGAPGLGSDVGGVLTLVPVAAVTLWALAGRSISWGRAAVAALGTGAVVVVLTVIDLTRPASEQTHLARLARGLAGGSGSNDVVVRKAVAARDSFVTSSLVWVVVCTVLLAVLLRAFDRDRFDAALRPRTARILVAAGVLLGVLGAALNDSGVMVPAMMASVLVPTAYHCYLAVPRPDPPVAPVNAVAARADRR